MKWKKFSLQCTKYPWLPNLVVRHGGRVDPLILSGGSLFRFVQTQVSGIAFRPFKSLDLEAVMTNGDGDGSPEWKSKCHPNAGMSYKEWYMYEWDIVASIGERVPIMSAALYANYARNIGRTTDSNRSLYWALREIEVRHSGKVLGEGEGPLSFIAAVKVVAEGTLMGGLRSIRFDVYPFPTRFSCFKYGLETW